MNVTKLDSANIASVTGNTTISQNSGNMTIGTISETLTLSSVDYGESTVANVKTLNATVNNGTLNVTNVTENATVNSNGGETSIASIGADATINGNGGKTTVGTVNGDATANAASGTTSFTKIVKNLWAKLTGGTVNADSVDGTSDISGNGTAVVGKTATANVHTSNSEKFVENGTGIETSGSLNVKVAEATNVNIDTVNGGDIQGMTKIENLKIASNVGELNIGTTTEVEGNIVITDSSANVNIGNLQNLDVTLSNDADLIAKEGTSVSGTARVNGGCDATYENVNNLLVDIGLDGNLGVNGTVNTANIKNVSGLIDINTVATSAVITNSNNATIENANGTVNFDTLSGSATVNNATADISASSVAGGLNVGDVKNINVSDTNVNVLDGKTVDGNIVSSTDVTLTNGGSARIEGQINAVGKTITVTSDGFDLNENQSVVVKAAKIAGVSARDLIDTLYNKAYNIGEENDEAKIVSEKTLVGSYDNSAKNGRIEANLGDVDTAINTQYMKGYYSNGVNDTINYTITENSYIEQTYATTENEKAFAKVIDGIQSVDNGGEQDLLSVERKRAYMRNPSLLSAALPQSVTHAARMNMDLADMMHLDTLFRTSATRDMLLSLGRDLNKHGRTDELVRGTTIVSVRNMNRFASYGGDANVSGSDDYIYGGLANIEYIANEDLFGGFGIGGFEAKSEGKGTSGKAETQSVALNLYGDYAFYPNFDWYFGLSYAFGMNEADRNNLIDQSKSKWDSNMVGVFTGVRYAWKPYADREFYIRPTVGINANFLMNPSFEEDTGSEKLAVDSANYTSVKSLVGVEATYAFLNGFHLAGRMFYTHEFGDDTYDVNATFLNSGSSISSFRMKGWKMDRDAGVFGVGVGYDITKAWRVYLDYAAEVSSDIYHNLNAGVQFKF